MTFLMTFGPKNKFRMFFHKNKINKSKKKTIKKFLGVKHVLQTSVKNQSSRYIRIFNITNKKVKIFK